VTREEFLDTFGDEFTGLLCRNFGEVQAIKMVETDNVDRRDGMLGRAFKRREARALVLLDKMYTALTEKPNEQAGTNGKVAGGVAKGVPATTQSKRPDGVTHGTSGG
jgi:hypothetical protein